MDAQPFQPTPQNFLAHLSIPPGIYNNAVCTFNSYIVLSLQLKNMINALFSSKPTGSKLFQCPGNSVFGWQTINQLYERELARVSSNQTRMVPRLREAHCLRDAWTKLNVHPAKIMQVRNFTIYNLSIVSSIIAFIKLLHLLLLQRELVHFVNQDPPPHNVETTCETLAYLEACNLLFEQGFLSHDRIRSTDSEVIKNINKGFEYFSKWLDSILDKRMYNSKLGVY